MRFMTRQTATEGKGKAFVGMSGGVDSSVTAALLKAEGYDVTGVFIKVWQPDWFECTWREDRLDAMRVCVALGIPLVTLDLEDAYKREVVDYMVSEYKAGRTPNPDVMCNRHVKFGGFFDWAMAQGADFVATGHYARIERAPEGGAAGARLLSGRDQGKDQSYFLWTLTPGQLLKTLFPVGGMEKPEVRRLARKFKLPVAEKRDSQGLCFIGKVGIKEFLSHYVDSKRGDVLNEKGEKIGEHGGALFLTLGERHGFTVTKRVPDDRPYYVVARDVAKNTVTVAHERAEGGLGIERLEYSLSGVSWIGEAPQSGKAYRARIRHLGNLHECEVELAGKDAAEIGFRQPIAIAAGQSVVVYDGDRCVGGGVAI